MKVLHFGAGNIGRGFIGILLKNSNYEITFVDVSDDLVNEINEKKAYEIKYLDEDSTSEIVSGVQALHGIKQVDEIIEQIATCDLITTSMGQDNLKYITRNIALGLSKRCHKQNYSAMDIIACENGIKVSSFFKTLIMAELCPEEQEFIEQYVGFVDTTVDRIVPNQVNENICDVQVEPAFEWVLDQGQVKQNFSISDANYENDLGYYNKRKLLTVNLTHSLIGYIGYQKKYQYVHEAIADPIVEQIVVAALNDIAQALVIEFGVELAVQLAYSHKTLSRFKNKRIVDELSRVARNPLTKLSKDERYISPLKILIANQAECSGISTAIAYALAYNNPAENQAMDMQDIIKVNGIKRSIELITGLEDENVINLIVQQYEQITL